jgi:hypothetical protein
MPILNLVEEHRLLVYKWGRQGSIMDWTSRMRDEETRLRGIVARLGGPKRGGIHTRAERLHLHHALNRNLARTKAFLRDCMSGRSEYEQCLMEYRVRMEFPLYSHLNSIFSIQSGAFANQDDA